MSMKVGKSSKVLNRPLSPLLVDIYSKLEEQVGSLLFSSKLSSSYSKLYKHVEFLCRERQQSKLVTMIYGRIDAFENQEVENLKDSMVDGTDLQLLERFVRFYDQIEEKSKALAKIFLYLDRTYLLNHPTKKTIENYALDGIYSNIFGNDDPLLPEAVMNAFISALNEYRKSNYDLLPLLSSFIKKLLLVSSRNIEELHSFIVNSTEKLYVTLHGEVLLNDPVLIYDHFCDIILREFTLWERVQPSSKFLNTIKFSTVSNLLFLNFEKDGPIFIKPLFINKEFQKLSYLFKFIQGAKTEEINKVFLSVWNEYIIDYITALTKDDSENVVEKLIKAKKNLQRVVSQFFDSDSAVNYKLIDAFQFALNESQRGDHVINNRLLKYIDAYLKKNDTDNDNFIDDIFLIFKSIRSKESFIKLYHRDLSKRLINFSSKDLDRELELVTKLETEVDSEHTKSMHTMIDDILRNRAAQDIYHSTHPDTSYEFVPLILNSQAWPMPRESVSFPDELASTMSEFQSYYLNMNDKHKLQWCPSLGSMNIITTFPKCGEKELQVNTFQGLVLLHFNTHDEASFQDLKNALQLETKTLTSILYSLSQGRYKVLLKFKKGDLIYYRVNEDFNERRKSIKIKQIQMKLKGRADENEDIEESPPLDESVMSYIVRLMKDVRVIEHDKLVERILDKFSLGHTDIKRKIEQLIDTEYIARDSMSRYRYIP